MTEVQVSPSNRSTSLGSQGELGNGLRWAFAARPGSEVVAIQGWVAIGSAREAAGEEGLAHLHEHMLFKRTETLAPGDLDRQVAELGGEVNAWTSYDETVYHLLLPANAFEQGLELMGQMLSKARFDEADLDSEKAVVVEEIREAADDPRQMLSRRLFRQAYGAEHPLARDIAGEEKTIAGMDLAGLHRFYRNHYHPESVVVAVAGDLDEASVRTALESRLGNWGTPPRQEPSALPPRQRGEGVSLAIEPVAESFFSIAFPVDSLARRDRMDLDLIALALGQGDSSRLLRSLQYDRQLTNGIGAYLFDPLGPGLFVVSGTTDQARLLEAVKTAIRVVGRLTLRPLSTQELERARRQVLLQWRAEEETAEDQAARLGYYRLHRGDTEAAKQDLDWVRSATTERLHSLAKRIFSEGNQVLAASIPRGGAPEIAQVHLEAAVAGAWAGLTNELAINETLPKPDAQGRIQIRLPSGVELAMEQRKGSGLFALQAAWRGGALLEGQGDHGLHVLMAATQTEGTESLGEMALARRLDDLGASLVAQAGRNSYSLLVEGLTESFEESLELFLEALKRPRFEASSVDRERMIALEAVRSRDDRPAQRAFQLAAASLFGSHPYGRPLGGSEETLRHLSAETIRQSYHQHYGQNPPAIMVVGDFDPELFLERIQANFPAPQDGEVEAPEPPALELQPPPESPAVLLLPREQVHVVRLYPGPALGNPDVPKLLVLAEILGGQSGRLFDRLREREGLVYSVSATPVLGLQASALSIHFSTSPKRLKSVRSALDAVIRELSTQGPTEAELRRAQRALVAGYRLRHQSSSDRARSGALDLAYGLGLQWERQLQTAIEALPLGDLGPFAAALFGADKAHEAQVGPEPANDAVETPTVSMDLTPRLSGQ